MNNYHCASHLIDAGVFEKLPIKALQNVKLA